MNNDPVIRIAPLFPLFTLASLGLLVIVANKSPLFTLLATDWLQYLGFTLFFLGWLLQRLVPTRMENGYDLICLGCLLIWFVLWQDDYNIDTPLFLLTPAFFILFNLVVTASVINQKHRIDPADVKLMLSASWLGYYALQFLPFMLLVSLYMPSHYLLHPALMSLLVTRYAFETCLQK